MQAIRALFWGNRVGKTEWGAHEVARYALGEHPFRQVIQPVEVWCGCPSYDAQKDTTQKKLEKFIPRKRIVDITHVKKNTWGQIVIDNGTRLDFKSYEQGREKFQGTGKRLVWLDEEPPKDIWEEIFVRVEAGIPLDIILTMTAIKGMTWVYDDIYLNTSNPDIFVSTAGWKDNPYLTEEQKIQMRRGLSPQALLVREEGKFVKRIGLVCSWWDRAEHLDNLRFSKDWSIGAALDFGFSHPACFELIGADYDDNLNIFDGFYETGLTSPKIAQRIKLLCDLYHINMHNLTIVADSAQAQSIQELNDISSQDENRMGFSVIGISKVSKTDGQNWDEFRAEKMYQYGEVKEKKTKIKVSSNLIYFDEKEGKSFNWFVKEAESLRWNETASPISGDKQQGAIWDARFANHAIDTFSYYLVDHLEGAARPDPPKPWEGKIPGTYIPPAEEEQDGFNVRFEEI